MYKCYEFGIVPNLLEIVNHNKTEEQIQILSEDYMQPYIGGHQDQYSSSFEGHISKERLIYK